MITFAFLGNTLFLTILVSMLSNTFSLIAANATAEVQFRRAVLTFEGVKSDAIFAYMPPFNIIALVVMLPLKFMMSERMFHKANVVATRTLNAPLLLIISLYERQTLWRDDRHLHRPGPSVQGVDWNAHSGSKSHWWTQTFHFWNFSRFSVHGDIQAVFETEPPHSLLEDIAEDDDLHGREANGRKLHAALEDQFPGIRSPRHMSPGQSPRSNRAASNKSAAHWKDSASDKPQVAFAEHGDDSEHSRDSKSTNRPARLDSIVDYGPDGSAMDEANERLHKLEDGMARIEEMLATIIEQRAQADQDMDDDTGSDVDAALNQEIETGIHE
jgi:hypothetical protein